MRKSLLILLACVGVLALAGCEEQQIDNADTNMQKESSETAWGENIETGKRPDEPDTELETETEAATETAQDFFDEEGMTLETRVQVPNGYTRVDAVNGSFTEFVREYPLKEAGSPVLLYNGREKGNQNAHAAVFALSVEDVDLQQCADSVMRMYAEYFYQTGQYDRIKFHFVNGFLAEYTKWRDGNRISVSGNDVSWTAYTSYDDSYETFEQYMKIVFTYASTLSMEAESEEIPLHDIQAGDIFLRGGSPGHVVMVVDVCVNEDGKKAFLLGQGYMPAQEFHLLKNPMHGEDPWYYEDEVAYPFSTPEYTFFEGSLRRLNY